MVISDPSLPSVIQQRCEYKYLVSGTYCIVGNIDGINIGRFVAKGIWRFKIWWILSPRLMTSENGDFTMTVSVGTVSHTALLATFSSSSRACLTCLFTCSVSFEIVPNQDQQWDNEFGQWPAATFSMEPNFKSTLVSHLLDYPHYFTLISFIHSHPVHPPIFSYSQPVTPPLVSRHNLTVYKTNL